MDTSRHSLSALFDQLGLPSDRAGIDSFVTGHKLAVGQSLADAPFWNRAQATFLRDALLEDSDWAEEADELAVLLSR
ncbi:DUF2789 domain-containing protein [Metapseudomonas resinovorans]|uniref:DUF2789 domain-containing protein n=1 Tax=Metapseudomonas resinovorans NBRC 106553 TaxID=1245471 RepID=S6BIC5_METRE|nr:DUF2789 domain-containing protein [Pseudomonas resinovorans]BAN48919.1 hypothetical protein PCA10_31870 [Pseudomonas resinovorans NBRC 106553]